MKNRLGLSPRWFNLGVQEGGAESKLAGDLRKVLFAVIAARSQLQPSKHCPENRIRFFLLPVAFRGTVARIIPGLGTGGSAAVVGCGCVRDLAFDRGSDKRRCCPGTWVRDRLRRRRPEKIASKSHSRRPPASGAAYVCRPHSLALSSSAMSSSTRSTFRAGWLPLMPCRTPRRARSSMKPTLPSKPTAFATRGPSKRAFRPAATSASRIVTSELFEMMPSVMPASRRTRSFGSSNEALAQSSACLWRRSARSPGDAVNVPSKSKNTTLTPGTTSRKSSRSSSWLLGEACGVGVGVGEDADTEPDRHSDSGIRRSPRPNPPQVLESCVLRSGPSDRPDFSVEERHSSAEAAPRE
mmetsp:Transcript_22143/g.48973  ORF Transcript_22143/g.48973 Transcript_22143/m.48973 type:complete len:354 (-) Transcript_22143:144-1205(-)